MENGENQRIPLNNNGNPFPSKKQTEREKKNLLQQQSLSILKKSDWNHPAGIDKIKLHIPSTLYELSSVDRWAVVPNRKNQTELFVEDVPIIRTTDGEIICAEKVYHNSNRDIGKEDTENISFSINGSGLAVEFNPSKIKGMYYGKLAGIGDVKDVVGDVMKYGNDIGLTFPSFDDIKVSRLDYAKDREMEFNVHSYQQVFRGLELKRSKNRAEFPSGFYDGNSMREFNVYDKGAEVERILPNSKYMRVEYRALKTETNKREGIQTLRNLCDWSDEGVSTHYSSIVSKDLLKINNETTQSLDFDDAVPMIQALHQRYGRGAVMSYYAAVGYHFILREKSVREQKEILESTGLYNRHSVWKFFKKMEEMMSSMKSKSKRYSVIEKYNEICGKFAA